MSEDVQLNVRIPKKTRMKLNVIAEKKETSSKQIIKELIDSFIEKNKELL